MRKRRRRIDMFEEFLLSMLKQYIGSFWASILARAINKFAKDAAVKIFKHFGVNTDDLAYEDEFDLFI